MKSFEEIKATNRDGLYYAIGSNGVKYEAVYSVAYKNMFFCIPASVEIIGYIER